MCRPIRMLSNSIQRCIINQDIQVHFLVRISAVSLSLCLIPLRGRRGTAYFRGLIRGCFAGRYEEAGGGRGRAVSRGVFVVLHGIVRSSYIAPDGTEIVRSQRPPEFFNREPLLNSNVHVSVNFLNAPDSRRIVRTRQAPELLYP